ncbi:hypothetical protein EDB81DRAFT_669434 [Dactylonectria macrodidyma]|uniref:Rhodopsin domain-containing protein n=1 Tax=Dactylonectria macrodidyma TaxID=307937 RepID=A0A9P9D8W5_9HYPO|nr:hypothetical protein EDB81DRAFT_669434 [Dactylonectria macrodidyma]
MTDPVIRTESQGSLVVGIAVGFIVASGAIILLRLYTRLVLLKMAGPDDWTILASMYLYVCVILYNVGMNLVKISFLFQYRRIFQSTRVHKICFWAMIGVIFWACLQATLLGISCLPISFLVPSTAGWCLDTLPIWFFSSAMSLATDILIFCIPLPSVLKLQLPIKQKIMVALIFCLGFFVCIISVYRMTTLREAVSSDDPPWDNVGAAIWSVIELNCAIICASLPTLRPLVAKVVPGMSSNHSNYASYERYGSQYATGSSSQIRARPTVKGSKSSPRSISTEELALNDMDSSLQSGMPTVYVKSSGRHTRHDYPRHIMVTTETSVNKHEEIDKLSVPCVK